MVSLKRLEFEMRAETIENFEVDHRKTSFTEREAESLVKYCHNDVWHTYQHYLYTVGETSHPLYKGKNKILDRQIIMGEVGLPCLNWDDVKIGAEWNKKDYISLSGKRENQLKPKNVNHFFGKRYKKFFPETVSFQSEKLNQFVAGFGDSFILNKTQEFSYSFNPSLTVTLAKGGLHSTEKPRIIRLSKNEWYIQNDIASQYPNAMRKYNIFPRHLGKPWNQMLTGKIQRRLKFKEQYKKTKDPKYNSLQEMGKLSLNGGAFGRLNTRGDWQQDPCAMLKITVGCQLEILMIVEALVLKGFVVTSCNTDGWDAIVPQDRIDEYFGIVEYYEELIGNKEMGNVEYTVFSYMVQTSVNDYMAEKIGVFEKRKFIEDTIVTKESSFPHLKLKGDFSVDIELHKNSSFRIIPLALVNYFANGMDIEEFINSYTDVFDFCGRSNSGKTYTHKGFKDNKEFSLPKLIRYYVAKDGIHIKKMVKEGNDTGANDSGVRPAELVKKTCNSLLKEEQRPHLLNVNRQWYIDKAKEIAYKIETGKNPKRGIENPNQISMF